MLSSFMRLGSCSGVCCCFAKQAACTQPEPIDCAGCVQPDCKDQYRLFCQKALHCLAGGGIGAILYNRVDAPDCQPLLGATIKSSLCSPKKPDLMAVAVSKGQGLAIKAMLDKGTKVTATLSVQDGLKTAQPYGCVCAGRCCGVDCADLSASGIHPGNIMGANHYLGTPPLQVHVGDQHGHASGGSRGGHGVVGVPKVHQRRGGGPQLGQLNRRACD